MAETGQEIPNPTERIQGKVFIHSPYSSGLFLLNHESLAQGVERYVKLRRRGTSTLPFTVDANLGTPAEVMQTVYEACQIHVKHPGIEIRSNLDPAIIAQLGKNTHRYQVSGSKVEEIDPAFSVEYPIRNLAVKRVALVTENKVIFDAKAGSFKPAVGGTLIVTLPTLLSQLDPTACKDVADFVTAMETGQRQSITDAGITEFTPLQLQDIRRQAIIKFFGR